MTSKIMTTSVVRVPPGSAKGSENAWPQRASVRYGSVPVGVDDVVSKEAGSNSTSGYTSTGLMCVVANRRAV